MIEEVFQRIGSAGFWLDAAILTALVRFVWTVVQRLTEWVLFSLALRTRWIEITFIAQPDVPPEIAALKLLVIRYGTDDYLRDMASDQERYHGRLRNAVHRVRIESRADGGRLVRLKLKVHRRLGTQFKLFLDVNGDAKPVLDYLELHQGVHSVDVATRFDGRKRVFFLLRAFPEIETVDGFRNNMIFPV